MAQPEKILVTGAQGTLGHELVSRLGLFPQFEVVGTTRHTFDLAEEKQNLWRRLDELKPQIIVNTAAFTHVDGSETERDLAMRVNAWAPLAMAQWAELNQAYMVQISTDYVFDGKKVAPYESHDEVCPVNYYGVTKLAGEKAVLDTLPGTGLVLRTSWLFGRGGKNFVPFVIQAAQRQTPIRVADDQWGTPSWTGNVCKMILEVLESRPSGVLHACSQGQTTRYEQALFLCRAMGLDSGFMTPMPTAAFNFPAPRPLNTAMKTSFDAALSWQEATEKYLQTEGLRPSHV